MKVPVLQGPSVRGAEARPLQANVNFHHPVADGSAITRGVEQLGQGVSQVGQVVAHIFAQEEQKQTVAATAKATGDFQTVINTAFDGDAENNVPGFLQQRGDGALGKLHPTMEQLEKARSELLTKLPTRAAQEQFDLQSKQMYESARDRANRHVDTQTEVAAESDLNVATSAALNGLPSAFADPNSRSELIARPRAQIERLAQLKGVDPAPAVAAYEQKAHGIIVEQYLLNNDPMGARDYLAANKAALGVEAPKYEGRVKVQAEQQEALTEASRITQENRVADSPWVDPVKAFAAVDAMPDSPKKEAIRREVHERITQSNAARDSQAKQNIEGLFSLQAQGKSTRSPEGIAIRQWMADPANGAADKLVQFDEHQESMRQSRESAARARQNDLDADARRAAADQLHQMNRKDKSAMADFMARDPAEITSMTPEDIRSAYMGKASDDAINGMIRQHNGFMTRAAKGSGGGSTNGISDKDYSALLTDMAGQAGLAGSYSTGQTRDFRARMKTWQLEETARTGKPPGVDDIEAQAAKQLMLYKKPGAHFWNSDEESFGFEMAPDESEGFKPADTKEQPLYRNRAPESAKPPEAASPAPKARAGFTVPTTSGAEDGKPAIPITSGPIEQKNTWKLTGEDYNGITRALKAKGIPITDAAIKRASDALRRRSGG